MKILEIVAVPLETSRTKIVQLIRIKMKKLQVWVLLLNKTLQATLSPEMSIKTLKN